MSTTYTLSGALVGVSEASTHLVEAHARNGRPAGLVEVAKPDRFGRFAMTLDEGYLRSLFQNQPARLVFKVFDGSRLVGQGGPEWSVEVATDEIRLGVGDVPRSAADRSPSTCVVRGRVHASDLTDGWKLRLLDEAVRGPAQLLAEVAVGTAGAYEAAYERAQLTRLGKLHADLIIEVTDATGTVRHTSPVLHQARPTLIADVILDAAAAAGPSTFARLSQALAPRLGDIAPQSLTETEVASLSRSTGIEAIFVERWVDAHRLSAEAAQGTSPIELGVELAFALVAAGVPPIPDRVASLRAVQVRAHVAQAVARRHVAPIPATTVDRLVAELRSLATTDDALGAHSRLHALLQTSLTATQAASAVSSWFDHKGNAASWWANLSKLPAFHGEATRARLKLTLQLGALTGGHLPLVSYLQGRGHSARDLAAISEEEWFKIVAGSVGTPPGTTPDAYSRHLAEAVEAAFPSAVVAEAIWRHTRDDERSALSFLRTHPEFDLGSGRVRQILTRDSTALRGIHDPVGTVQELHRLQRVFRITRGPNRLDAMRALLDAGLDSSLRISRLSRTAFRRRMKGLLGDDARTDAVWRRAQRSAAHACTAAVALRGDAVVPAAAITPAPKWPPTSRAVAEAALPDLAQVFSRFDVPASHASRSLLSPAAYLVDLLQFLEGRPTDEAGTTAYDLLLKRRPDIALLRLDRANTETELPAIDLVNEVLEHAVASLQSATARTSDPDDVPWLGTHFPTDEWPRGRQSGSTASDLATRAEHSYPSAYARLGQDTYPWTLPFDLGDEQARALLPLVGTTRAAVMEALGTGDRAALAREILGSTPQEWSLIGTPLPSSSWGSSWDPSGSWSGWWALDVVPVAEFLRRSGLDYAALCDCLRADHVNPATGGWRIRVRFAEADPTGTRSEGDLEKAILGATVVPPEPGAPGKAALRVRLQEVLARVPRFTRLRRRLGWSARDLDRALVAFKPAAGDPLPAESATRCVEIDRLARDLGKPVADLLLWWAKLPADHPLFQRDPAFALDESGTELANPEVLLAELSPRAENAVGAAAVRKRGPHLAALAEALEVAAQELDELLAGAPLTIPDTRTDDEDPRPLPLTLANLTVLVRERSLARALGLSVSEAMTLRRLCDVDPFQSPAAARHFVTEARAAAAAPLALRELDTLLRGENPVAPLAEALALPADPAVLPAITALADAGDLRERYAAWRRLRDVHALRERLGGVDGPLLGILRAVAERPDDDDDTEWTGDDESSGLRKTAILDTLVAALGWPAADLAFLAGPGGFDLGTPGPWKDERRWSRLADALDLAQRTGLSAAQLFAIARPGATAAERITEAASLRALVRRRLGEAEWPTAAQSAQDGLRRRQRDALVARIVAHGIPTGTIADQNRLDQALLIDSRSGPARRTTRIAEAISAVQRFVEQGLLGRVDGLVLDADDRAAWSRLGRQDAWQLDRQAFLWPENDLRPTDTTPFFEALAADLRGEVTPRQAEAAYRGYLEKLDGVARLTVLGQVAEGDRLHLVACTETSPRRTFYRVRHGRRWGPWEPVDVDYEGRHLVPVVWKGCVHLFWPVFADHVENAPAKDAAEGDEATTAREPEWSLDVALAWSRLSSGRFMEKRLTGTLLRSASGHGPVDRSCVRMSVHEDASGDLLVVLSSDGGPFDPEDPSWRCIRLSAEDGAARSEARAGDLPGLRFWTPEHDAANARTSWNGLAFENSAVLPLPDGPRRSDPLGVVLGRVEPSFDLRPLVDLSDAAAPKRLFLQDARRTFLLEAVDRVAGWSEPDAHAPAAESDDDKIRDPLPRVAGATLDPGARGALVLGGYVPDMGASLYGHADRGGIVRYGQSSANDSAPATTPDESPVADVFPDLCWTRRTWRLQPFYHPYAGAALRHLEQDGLDRLAQVGPRGWTFDGPSHGYAPTELVETSDLPREELDFSVAGPYAAYNWELFVFAPLQAARSLAVSGHYEAAASWLQLVFDPRETQAGDDNAPSRRWKVRPFSDVSADPALSLFSHGSDPADLDALLDAWAAAPGAATAARLRRGVLQRRVVLDYVGNLVAWGDAPQARGEHDEARRRYELASDVLGPRPLVVERPEPAASRYVDLRGALATFSDALVDVEDALAVDPTPAPWDSPFPMLTPTAYFGVPRNEKVLVTWDLVEDGLRRSRQE